MAEKTEYLRITGLWARKGRVLASGNMTKQGADALREALAMFDGGKKVALVMFDNRAGGKRKETDPDYQLAAHEDTFERKAKEEAAAAPDDDMPF